MLIFMFISMLKCLYLGISMFISIFVSGSKMTFIEISTQANDLSHHHKWIPALRCTAVIVVNHQSLAQNKVDHPYSH